MTLDDVLRDLAKRGELTHLSLAPSQNGKMWRASFASSKVGISFAEDADPAKAILVACRRPAKPRPRVSAPQETTPEDIEALM